MGVSKDERVQTCSMLCGEGDHGCHEVTKLLPSAAHREGGRLP
ncbi:hypothetical protein [Streptomyces sp. bgisy082]